MSFDTLARSDDVDIRRMRDDEEDYRLMARWLSDERVLEFYEGRDKAFNLETVIEKFSPRALGEDRVVPCFILYGNRPIGYIQYYPVSESEGAEFGLETAEKGYGVDLFIGEPELWGRGIGTRALSALVGYLFGELGSSRVFIDPQASNQRAIRSYEKCGFRKIRLLPKHELHEGEYRDIWLMTMNREEFLARDASRSL